MTFQHTPYEVVLEAPPAIIQVEEVKVAPIKTFDTEITRLANKYGQSESLARRIIKCEAQMYGSAVNENRDSEGLVWSRDWSYFQINDYYHEATARKMGLDIKNGYDNLEYGFYLMSKQGTTPWGASRHCWSI